jgi:hypothetical protein
MSRFRRPVGLPYAGVPRHDYWSPQSHINAGWSARHTGLDLFAAEVGDDGAFTPCPSPHAFKGKKGKPHLPGAGGRSGWERRGACQR